MSTSKTPRTDEIMLLVRKAFNAPHLPDALKFLGESHDAIEKFEKEFIELKHRVEGLEK